MLRKGSCVVVQSKVFRVGVMLYTTAASGAYITIIPKSLGRWEKEIYSFTAEVLIRFGDLIKRSLFLADQLMINADTPEIIGPFELKILF